MNAVETQRLEKVYTGGNAAVQGLDLEVRRGEIFGFLGPNGAGKTTTVRMLTTLTRPTAGTARVAGFDLARQPHEIRARIGVALQEAGLDDVSTGREALEIQGVLQGLRAREARGRTDELLATVGLADVGDHRIGTYSGGMKRRLDLATALVARPDVLFLDEPTTGLDPASRRAIWEEVRRLNREGTAVFLTTQYLEEADQLADRIAIIDRGRIIQQGKPASLKSSICSEVIRVAVPQDKVSAAQAALTSLAGVSEIRAHQRSLTVFLAEGARTMAEVVRVLDRASVPVESLTYSAPTLDDVFLRATGNRLEGNGAREEAS